MKVCLISSEHSPWGGIGNSVRRLASLLAQRHEVTVIYTSGPEGRSPVAASAGVREIVAEPSEEVRRTACACEDHLRSVAALEAIERAYGDGAPDFIEFCDFRGHGLVTLQARRAGHQMLRDTLIGLRLCGSSELVSLHDGTLNQPVMRLVADIEREQLRLADVLLWPGGDILGVYRRYYSDLRLPEPVCIRRPLDVPADPPAAAPRPSGEPLRLLYVGRLQRLKGVFDLAEAVQGLVSDEWELTMIGADTPTAALGQSAQLTIEAIVGDDPRVTIQPPLPHDELRQRWAEYDVVVVPSRFEVWCNVALEAMRAGVPVLATPVGGLAEVVEPGVNGWRTDSLGSGSIRRALDGLLEDRGEVERMRSSGAVFERLRSLVDPEQVVAAYDRLLEGAPRRQRPTARPQQEPSVTGIVPYYKASEYVEEAVASLLAQTHRNLDVVIVNDGSFSEDDAVLDRLAEDPRVSVANQLNRGESSARNLAIRLAGGDYLAMLDSDNLYEPEFVARALELLVRDPNLAYVTCWLRYIASDGSPLAAAGTYAALGNSVISSDSDNWDGDTIAVFPRRVFGAEGFRYQETAPLHADWELYRQLRRRGRFGAVIPERLARYRVHSDSVTKSHDSVSHERAHDEEVSRRKLDDVCWTAKT